MASSLGTLSTYVLNCQKDTLPARPDSTYLMPPKQVPIVPNSLVWSTIDTLRSPFTYQNPILSRSIAQRPRRARSNAIALDT